MKATCHIIFCVIVRVIPIISFAKFHEKHTKPFSRNREMCPIPPPEKLKIVASKGQYPS